MFYVYRNRRPISEGFPTREEAKDALLSGRVRLSNRRYHCGFDQHPITIREGAA